MRVPSLPDVFSIGDCCGYLESTGKPTLPALAQASHFIIHMIDILHAELRKTSKGPSFVLSNGSFTCGLVPAFFTFYICFARLMKGIVLFAVAVNVAYQNFLVSHISKVIWH